MYPPNISHSTKIIKSVTTKEIDNNNSAAPNIPIKSPKLILNNKIV